jgi:hypothetical protein
MVKRVFWVLAAAAVLFCNPMFAAEKIVANSTVYIEPMDGFGGDLQAAFLKKHVELTMVDDPSKADYVLEGRNENQKAGWAKTIFVTPAPSEHASVTLKDRKTGAILFAYSVDKLAARHGPQSAAEACAKHLREAMKYK